MVNVGLNIERGCGEELRGKCIENAGKRVSD